MFSCVLCVFLWFIFSFFLIVYFSVTVKWLAVKTASEMTYTVSGGALNSTQSNPIHRLGPKVGCRLALFCIHRVNRTVNSHNDSESWLSCLLLLLLLHVFMFIIDTVHSEFWERIARFDHLCDFYYIFVAWQCAVFVLAASRSNSAKTCVKPAPHSDQRKSRFYRRSNSASSSSSSLSSARFHCDVSVMCDTAADDGHFMFNFTTEDVKTDKLQTDRVSNNDTDSHTVRGRNTQTSSVTGNDIAATYCDKNVTSRSDNFTMLNSALCFNASTQGTPFLFNFDSW